MALTIRGTFMKISVIIPVYNCEKYLERCLDSVLRQRLDDGDELQIITVDDGSTDGSGAILDRYATEHSNILVLHQPNQGVSAARNHALDVAEGDYIHFVDSDDFLLYDNSYQRLLEIFKSADAPIDVLRIDYVNFYENYPFHLDQYKDLSEVKIEFDGSGREFCHQLLFRGNAWYSITRRRLIEDLNLQFNTHACVNEDSLFYLKLYFYAERVVKTDAPIYGYFKHAASVTYTKDKKRLHLIIDNMFDNLPETEAVLDLYEDPYFKHYRMECQGLAIAERLLRSNHSFGEFRRYIKRGFDCGIFPIGEIIEGKNVRRLDMLLKRPLLFWILSLSYGYIFVPMIKPLLLKLG